MKKSDLIKHIQLREEKILFYFKNHPEDKKLYLGKWAELQELKYAFGLGEQNFPSELLKGDPK